MNKRIMIALLAGAGLGLVCVIGATVRLGWEGNQLLIISLWYNRLLLGLLIGLAGNLTLARGNWNWILRGLTLGLAISAAYFLTAGGRDWISFLVGAIYGLVIEFTLHKLKL